MPDSFKIQTSYDRQLLTRRFDDYKDVPAITNDFMDIVIRSISIPKDTLTALEWSMYEVCDNVINHSESKIGGFVEAVTYSKEGVISFTVADSGRGILASLKEGIPTLKNHVEAIGEAIKEGVTRNKQAGQGNGLAGSLRVTNLSGGSLDITTGAGRFFYASGQGNKLEGNSTQLFKGTSVSGQIRMNKKFSIGKALFFNGISYAPENIIDSHYEMKNEDSLLIKLSKETTGVGTRKAGKQVNTITLNLIDAKPNYPIYVDWEGIPVISSSFADEFIGKLYTEIGKELFDKTIRNINMEPIVKQLLNKAIFQRIEQENS